MERSIGVMSITPFTKDGEIDKGLLRDHFTRSVELPVCVYVCSQGSGEGLALSIEDKELIYRTAVEVLGGKCRVVGAGVGLTGDTNTAREQLSRLSATGVDAVQVFPPRIGALRPRDEEIEQYYDEILKVAKCAIVLGENWTLAGFEMGPKVIRNLIDRHDNIEGLSYTAPGGFLQFIDVITELRERVEIRSGWFFHMASMAALGGHGILNFEANVAPKLVAAVWSGFVENKPDTQANWAKLLPMSALLSRYGNPASIKVALRHLGLPAGELRAPQLMFSEDKQRQLIGELDQLLADGLASWI